MTGEQRRQQIISMLQDASKPLSGAAIGKACGVSRQVVVTDIALLRSQGHKIDTSHYGYVMQKPSHLTRLFKVHHTPQQIQDELTAIVDLGGTVDDIIINHRRYGQMSSELNIRSRRDIASFMHDIESGKSQPLSTVTSGYHFHHVSADGEDILDDIEQELRSRGYLAEVFPYETDIV